jgi:hypothetical protein
VGYASKTAREGLPQRGKLVAQGAARESAGMAGSVVPRMSQSRSVNSSVAVVPNVRTSCMRWPFARRTRRHPALLVHVQLTSKAI